MHAHLLFYSHSRLVALLHRLVPALFRRLLPAFLLRDAHAHLVGDGDATLLGHLVAGFVGHLLALGIRHGGANLMWSCPALGVGNLLAVLNWQLLALLPRNLLALLRGSATFNWSIVADSFLLDLVVHSLVMGLVMHSLGSSFFLKCKLLGSKTKGKTSAETNLLGNVSTNHCTSKASKEGPFLPDASICRHISTFNLLHTYRQVLKFFAQIFSFRVNTTLFFRSPLPLLILGLLVMMMHLNLNGVTFFLLFHPAFRHVFALLGVLCVARLLVLRATDLRIFSGALLGGLAVASLSWFIPTLLRVLGLALLVLVVALLLMLSVALLPVRRLTQLFILGLALRVVFSLAGGAVFSLALVLVLLHAHLFMFGLAVRCYHIFPLQMAIRLLELLLEVVPHSCKKASAGRCKEECNEQ